MPTVIRLPAATALHLVGRRLHLDGDAGLGGEIEDVMILAGGRETIKDGTDHELADRADVGIGFAQVPVSPFVIMETLEKCFDSRLSFKHVEDSRSRES